MGKSLWRLTDGRYWRADTTDRGDVLSTRGAPREKEVRFESRTISMSLNDLWLRNLGLSPQYLYLGDLRVLAHAQIMSQDLSGYKTRLQLDFGEAVFTVLMALMGAALSLHYFAYATRWFALVAVLLAGYLAHFASKAFILMGEFGYIAPFWAGWLAPLLLLAGLARVLVVLQKKRGLGVRLQDTPHYADAAAEQGAISG
jgi:lipopolysaccharide export LptBFGC system permease protein LptF